MNEIVRIHIAGVAYEIDIAAKKQLDSYIAAVRRSLADAKDVLEDIELRITEILGERGVYKNDVIKLSDIDAVREQLGDPKDFSSSEPHSRPRSEEKIADKIRYEFADKKYFRDSENGIIGGVVAGLANYTGWDLTLLRVLFAMLAIFTAFFPFAILYIVVWISAPEARTTTERLAMEGKPINIENIKQSAKDFAEKAEQSAKSGYEKIQQNTPAVTNLAARIILCFFGVVGLLTFIPLLIAAIPASVALIFILITTAIELKPLFIVGTSLITLLGFIVISAGISISVAMIRAKFSRSTRTELAVLAAFAAILLVAATATSAIWYSEVGHGYALDVIRSLHIP